MKNSFLLIGGSSEGVEMLLPIGRVDGCVPVSYTHLMEEVYSILSEKNLPYKILMQQPGSSQDKVLNEFKEDTNSVISFPAYP